jgi:hypothetical protein
MEGEGSICGVYSKTKATLIWLKIIKVGLKPK